MTTVVIGDNTGNDFSGTDDGQIKETGATTNYGSSATMETTKWAASDHSHSVLKFTGLSNITPPVIVSSVTLNLFLVDGSAGTTHAMDIRRLLRNWVEAEATWNIFATANNWTTAGALGDGNDRVAAASAQLSATAALAVYKSVTDTGQLALDVADWINGVNPNYGWHLSRNGTGNDGTYKQWSTSEAIDGNRPYLSVTYTPIVSDSAALTGTALASINEGNVVAGGKQIVITLTGDSWIPA
jgi:hypothetical protein